MPHADPAARRAFYQRWRKRQNEDPELQARLRRKKRAAAERAIAKRKRSFLCSPLRRMQAIKARFEQVCPSGDLEHLRERVKQELENPWST